MHFQSAERPSLALYYDGVAWTTIQPPKNTEIWPEHGFVQAETFAGENGEKTEKLLKNC